jgi:chromosome segregation ATPase
MGADMATTTEPTTELAPFTAATGIVDYGIAEQTIADLKSRYGGLTIKSQSDYEMVRLAIADVRSIRTGVEKSRKELKADALEYGRKVDAEAKRVTALLEAIELPLLTEKSRVDRERAAERDRKEAEARERLEAEQAEARRVEEERLAAEKAKREAEMLAEREKLAAERRELEAARQELAKAQQAEIDRAAAERSAEEARLETERAKLAAERAEFDRLEAERIARLQAERAEIERQERERLEAIERAEAEAKAAADRKRLAPDREKLREFASALESLPYPDVVNPEAKELVDAARGLIDTIEFRLREFASR